VAVISSNLVFVKGLFVRWIEIGILGMWFPEINWYVHSDIDIFSDEFLQDIYIYIIWYARKNIPAYVLIVRNFESTHLTTSKWGTFNQSVSKSKYKKYLPSLIRVCECSWFVSVFFSNFDTQRKHLFHRVWEKVSKSESLMSTWKFLRVPLLYSCISSILILWKCRKANNIL